MFRSAKNGRASTIDRLPAAVRREIDQRLIASSYSGYSELEAELRARGHHKVSKSGLHRYRQALKRLVQLGNAAEQLRLAGIDAALADELTGKSTLVVIIDRRNARARLINVDASAADVIKLLKGAPSPI
ncbi:MAG: DUF3486 family protein [Sulfuritalea sp.]|nr:DUF3486 family protein [Sulfuritalea sp.]